MSEEPMVDLLYALTESDMRKDELGRYAKMPLSEALRLAERMLRGSYIMVKLVKEVRQG